MSDIASGAYFSLYPAGVLFPSGMVKTRCKVFATPEGLAVYWRVPADGVSPDWFSAVSYVQTARPRPGRGLRNGWEVFTASGLVVVTDEGGCGCGWVLKRWSPPFARNRLRWPENP